MRLTRDPRLLRTFAVSSCLVTVAMVTACSAVATVPTAGSRPAPARPSSTPTSLPTVAPAALASGATAVKSATAKPTAKPAATRAKTPAAPAAQLGGSLPPAGNPGGGGAIPGGGGAVDTSHPDRVVGNGTAASCTSAAVVAAVAAGGIITFNCGPSHVTIPMTATAKVVNTSHKVVIDGGGKVTLSGRGSTRILYMNTCDKQQVWTTSMCFQQQWPLLVVQNIALVDGWWGAQQTRANYNWGGGALWVQGGQLKVVNSTFADNRCFQTGPDLGGGAVRVFGLYTGSPVYFTGDTFTGNSCANGGAISSLGNSLVITNSSFTGNTATGRGVSTGGGGGGAVVCDGNSYSVTLDGDVMTNNIAHEGGGGIFWVVDAGSGTLTIKSSTLHNNPSGAFQSAPGIFAEVDGHEVQPVTSGSSIS
jgi:hypothetical protein